MRQLDHHVVVARALLGPIIRKADEVFTSHGNPPITYRTPGVKVRCEVEVVLARVDRRGLVPSNRSDRKIAWEEFSQTAPNEGCDTRVGPFTTSNPGVRRSDYDEALPSEL